MSNVLKLPIFLRSKRQLSLTKVDHDKFENGENAGKAEMFESNDHSQVKKIDLEAQRKYKQMQAAFKEKCEAAYQEQRQKGYNDGLLEGKKEGQALYKEKINQANQLISDAEEAYGEYLSKAEPEIMRIALRIAESIINTTLEEEPERWMPLIKKAVAKVKEQKSITITVPPERFKLVLDHQKELSSLVCGANLQVFADEQLDSHECHIETPFGKIDASIDSQLKVMKQTLSEMMEAEKDESHSAN
ncbi:flagellar assembly protein FliH [Scopulibacillus daqui]|uniref:Flagellar assembly protein FliH n=1 Tax=Scopulibacillus daqui TaxID=1469162 RepID=A0ABS2PWE2_9BACL|nr:flagellar assembly protein FliH [Scopulibacillus daqui]MBM7644356.1 flagellar assembly protein FliH [Scopulibacillus daqui]